MSKVGRNDPCPCGSGKKFKKCCEQKSTLQRRSFSHIQKEVKIENRQDKMSSLVSRNIQTSTQTESKPLSERISTSPSEDNESEENHPSQNLES